ncbi:MAG: transporter [Eggerthellaceae bacterium]|jgi:drug/metabolite transporter (DMT)-like permease
MSRLKRLLGLHLLLMFYSLTGVLSKYAAGEPFLSPRFLLLYGGMLLILAIYALGWQQVLKRMPLTSAYANRAVAIVWGIIWGLVLFAEPVTLPKLIGAIFIMIGVVIFSYADNESLPEKAAADVTVKSATTSEGDLHHG